MEKKTKDIFERVKKYISEYQMISDGDTVVAGVSGGADSVCLLVMLNELLKEINYKLLAVHVHHGVREDAGLDADYTGKLCQELKVPFVLKKVDMEGYAKENGLSSEEAGRRLRYQAFEETAKQTAKGGTYKIAVAHNNNDRAETLLFNLFRGSGLKGLGSIRPVRDRIIRPLLCLERAEIEEYLRAENIGFCTDSTNNEDNYTRNRIRHHIIPVAQDLICPGAVSHMGAAADIFAETEVFVGKQTEHAYKSCVTLEDRGKIALDLNILRTFEPYLQKTVMLRCMERLTPYRKDITKEHIEMMLGLFDKDGSKEIFLPYGLKMYKEYDRAVICEDIIMPDYPPIAVTVPGTADVPGLGVFTFKYLDKDEFFCKKGQIIQEKTYTKWFDCDKITTALVLRIREKGDYLTINDAMQKKSVKEYMVNEKIPKMQRNRIYLLADGAHIMWIPGYRISTYYKVDENTKCILQVQLRKEQDCKWQNG